jgi:AraC-like DNA-binding protein/ligand-binding sensor protein
MDRSFLKQLTRLKILHELGEVYYRNTGMLISFQDPGSDGRILDYPKNQKSEYCKLIQASAEGLARCRECDRRGLAAARRKASYHIYRCHAGLVDVAIALEYKGTPIGSMYTGQVLLEPPDLGKLRRIHRRLGVLGIPFERLQEASRSVKVVDRGRLVFFARLLHLFANYILKAENELYLQKMVGQKARALARRELEKIKLEKTLKDLTISVLESRSSQPAVAARAGAGHEVIAKAQAFIRENFSRDIRLEDVARAVYLSPNYFSSLFRRVAGSTFRGYLVRTRLEAARELLGDTRLPIKEIVVRCGFKDYNYFNRTFTAGCGTTPARFRRGLAGEGAA